MEQWRKGSMRGSFNRIGVGTRLFFNVRFAFILDPEECLRYGMPSKQERKKSSWKKTIRWKSSQETAPELQP